MQVVAEIRSNFGEYLGEVKGFILRQAQACIFPLFIFVVLATTKFINVPGIPRYDLLLLLCLTFQWMMVRTGLEERREVLVICIFHALGLAMEIYKVSKGSWMYPDFGYSKVYGVPLYSGFMYASVASYLCQSWRCFDMKFTRWPKIEIAAVLGVLIYGNFYTNAYIVDIRFVLIPAVLWFFRGTYVSFLTSDSRRRTVPLCVALLFVALLVWTAENWATILGAYSYPHQVVVWGFVKFRIFASWFLLIVVSAVIIGIVRGVYEESLNDEQAEEEPRWEGVAEDFAETSLVTQARE
jgi:uncharacterized membrane protein YoaT (DUF817 family)